MQEVQNEINISMRPTERLLTPFLWIAQLEGEPKMDRKAMSHRFFSYVDSLAEEQDEGGESELARVLKLAAITKIPEDVVVNTLPASMNIKVNTTLLNNVAEKFRKVFGITVLQRPYLFRVSAIAYANYLQHKNQELLASTEQVTYENGEEGLANLMRFKLSVEISDLLLHNHPEDQVIIERLFEIMKGKRGR